MAVSRAKRVAKKEATVAAEKARQEVRVTLNDAIALVTSQARAEEITSRSLEQFIEEQIELIEGPKQEEDSESFGGILKGVFARNTPIPQRGQIADIERIRQGLNQLADAVIAEPEMLT